MNKCAYGGHSHGKGMASDTVRVCGGMVTGNDGGGCHGWRVWVGCVMAG